MIETITAFFAGLYSFLAGFLHIALMSVGVAIGLAIFFLVVSRLRKGRKKAACKKDLFQVHETTVYDRQDSIAKRLADEGKQCDKHDHDAQAEDDEEPADEAPADPEETVVEVKPTAADKVCAAKPVAVLRFEGDVYASGRDGIARLIDELIVNKDRFSKAIVIVDSPGGGVAHYGQLFAEMERIRKAGITLEVCVDTYAASGGYLMSVPAHKIIAAPFAMVGSIGVVSEFLNFHELLRKLGIQPLTLTAGKHKRTVTQFSEVTDDAKQKYLEQLEAIHRQFIKAVTTYRKVDADKVCTGDHWTAQESVDLGLNLVDELATSQEYLLKVNQDNELVFLSEKEDPFSKGIFRFITKLADHLIARIFARISGDYRA